MVVVKLPLFTVGTRAGYDYLMTHTSSAAHCYHEAGVWYSFSKTLLSSPSASVPYCNFPPLAAAQETRLPYLEHLARIRHFKT